MRAVGLGPLYLHAIRAIWRRIKPNCREREPRHEVGKRAQFQEWQIHGLAWVGVYVGGACAAMAWQHGIDPPGRWA